MHVKSPCQRLSKVCFLPIYSSDSPINFASENSYCWKLSRHIATIIAMDWFITVVLVCVYHVNSNNTVASERRSRGVTEARPITPSKAKEFLKALFHVLLCHFSVRVKLLIVVFEGICRDDTGCIFHVICYLLFFTKLCVVMFWLGISLTSQVWYQTIPHYLLLVLRTLYQQKCNRGAIIHAARRAFNRV